MRDNWPRAPQRADNRQRRQRAKRSLCNHSPLNVQTDRRIAEWLFLLTFVTCAYFFAGGGWNQNSQFDLTRAIVEQHTFAIDAYAGSTGHGSFANGHLHSNQFPRLSWVAAHPYR